MSVGILIGFDCLLRAGELLQLRGADIMMNDQLTFATINLPGTKRGKKRTGITDSVSVTDAPLIRLLARLIQIKQPGDSIIKRVPQAFRRCFRQPVDGLSLNNLLLKPYSVRRGRATSLFRGTNSLDVVVLKGRWATQRTARIYVNTSLQDIAAHSITSEAENEMSQACNLLHQEMAR